MRDDQVLDQAIRKIPDFPRPGVLFYDITGIIMKPEAFSLCINRMAKLYREADITMIAAIEARGFVFAAPLAVRLGLPLLLVRKRGKLPGELMARTYDLEYGQDTIEVVREDVKPGSRVLLVDDLIATGGTIRAAADLIAEGGGEVVRIFSVVGLPFLHYENIVGSIPVDTLIEYHGE